MVYSKLLQDIHKAGGEERQETQENKPLAIIQDSTQSRINQLQYLIDNRYVRIYEEITEEEFNLVFQKGNSDFGGREELKEL